MKSKVKTLLKENVREKLGNTGVSKNFLSKINFKTWIKFNNTVKVKKSCRKKPFTYIFI